MAYCEDCNTRFASRQSLWKHRQRKHTDQKNIIQKVINNVVDRAGMDQKPSLSPLQKTQTDILKPKTLTELAVENPGKPMNIDSDSEKSDSEMDLEENEKTDSDDESGSESDDIQHMPDNPTDLKRAFRNLYRKFQSNMETYNKLILILDELYRMNCLSKDECNAINEHLEKNIGL